jgi:hypothetical protein
MRKRLIPPVGGCTHVKTPEALSPGPFVWVSVGDANFLMVVVFPASPAFIPVATASRVVVCVAVPTST